MGDPVKDALLRFYQASMAEWAAPNNQQRINATIEAADAVDRLLYPTTPSPPSGMLRERGTG